jgi:tetratricopeptide (TPR) repeat protein
MDIGIFDVQVESFTRDLALAYVRRGYTHYRAGDVHGALAEFVEARRLASDDPYVHYLLGKTLLRQGRPREARVSLEEALRLCPQFIDAHYQLGKTFLAEPRPRLEQARAAFEAEVRVYSAHARAWHKLSRVYRELGERVAATEARRRASVHGYRKPRVSRSSTMQTARIPRTGALATVKA